MSSITYNKRFYAPITIKDVGIGGGEKYFISDKNHNSDVFCMVGYIYKVCLIMPRGNKITGVFNDANDYYIFISGKKYSYSNSDLVVISREKA